MDHLPPDLLFEQEAIKRKRAIAEMLMQQSMQPLDAPVVKGRFQGAISPFAGAAKMLQAYNAKTGIADADKAGAGIADKYRTGLADAVSNYTRTKAGAPGTPDETIVPLTPNDDEGNVMPASVKAGVPGVAGDPRRAIVEAMSSPYAPVQRIAQMDMTQLNRTEDRKAAQEQRNFELKQGFEQKKELLEIQVREGRITREEADKRAADLRREMQAAGFAQAQTMANVVAGLRQPPTPPNPIAVMGKDGKPEFVAPQNAIGRQPAGAKGGGTPALSATAQRELFEADDVANSSQNAINILRSIVTPDAKTGKSQNDLAFEGGTANVRRIGMSFVPVNSEGENATVDLQNKVTGQALEQLKAVFGGMPTEGERKVLMELQGSVNQKAAQRKDIFERAIKLAERRLSLSQDKAKRLREGTYFGAGVATNQDGGQWQDLK